MSLTERIAYWLRTVRTRERDEARRRKQAINAMRRYHAARTPENKRLYDDALRRLAFTRKELADARRAYEKLKRESQAEWKPRIVRLGVSTAAVFGGLGVETRATTHYAASPRARNLSEGLILARQFHAFHASKGWGGLSYHYLIPDTGEVILGRPVTQKGAHVANQNSGNVGINFFCTTGHRPTDAQKRTARWLIKNAHTAALPKPWRCERPLTKADIRGHKFWPGQSTACPGNFTPQALGIR